MFRFLLIFLLTFGFHTAIQAQKYAFISYSTNEGLPQSQVTAITQDGKGYLWVGTLGGLSRFNGMTFESYSSAEGLLNNRIKSLSYFQNAVWAGHDGGVSVIRGDKIQRYEFEEMYKSSNVSAIVEFNGRILVSSNGAGLFELKDDKLTKVILPNEDYERIRGMYVLDGKLYLASKVGALVTTDLKKFNFAGTLPHLSYSGLFISSSGDLYFTTYREGLYKLKVSDGTYRQIQVELDDHIITGGYEDASSVVWLRSGQGIIRIFKDGRSENMTYTEGLPLRYISCFFEDADGTFWIGSEGKGLIRFPGETFQYYDQNGDYPSSLFMTGFQKRNGDFYFGTYDGGIIRKKANGVVEDVYREEKTIWCSLQDVDGKDWFGTQSVFISIDQSGKIQNYGEKEGVPVRIVALYRVSPSVMYLGGNNWAGKYENGKITELKYKDDVIGTVRDFAVYKGELFCTSNLGLFVFRNNRFEQFMGVDEVLYNVETDGSGNLWFGSEEGLYRFDGKEIKRIPVRRSPGSNHITFLNYRNGQIYLGTNDGLFILSELNAEKPKSMRFGTGEGLVDLETNLNSGFFDLKGNFWFGTASGLVKYDPTVNRGIEHPPLVELRGIMLNYTNFDYLLYSKTLDKNGLPEHLVLPYNKNNLIFELDGISLSNRRSMTYQHWLEGLQDGWSPVTENPTISFTNLPAGDYTLHMRSVDLDGRISREIVVPFTIKQAFYKTWWFLLICSILVALMVFMLFKMRVRRINEINEKEKLEFKTRLLNLEQQSMNASMNRHFVFNSLNSIQYFINTQDRLSANKYLTNFAKLIRKNLDSASAEDNIITLQEELERLELYLSLESMRFKDRFDYKIEVKNVDTESVRIPAMIMQPFIENSIIHGILPNTEKKGQINIVVTQQNGLLEILIEDNGVGIDKSLSTKTDMDGDHRSRGMEITSKRIELLRKIMGNGISLEGPYEFEDNNRLLNGTRVLIKIPVEDLEDIG